METLFVVDEELCKKDGICAAECPVMVIDFSDSKKVPIPVEGAADICINCGHCVAVCPHGALTHRFLAPQDCLNVNKDMMLDEAATEHFLRYRRSIRSYKNKPVENEKLEKLIHISSYAPSGHNSQPIHWQVINGRNTVEKLAAHVIDWMQNVLEEHPDIGKMMHFDAIIQIWESGTDRVLRGCPALVLANGGTQDVFADAACKIALTYFELAVPAQGLGSCWAGYFSRAANTWPPLKQALGLSEGMTNYGTMMVGYPRFSYPRMPTRNTPKITWSA
ncbi:MAG: nitroreductase family protein [Proteobacteria bacterium]|nr:nitroreductase family protein [Pseudomonadota bacterium]MBU1388651.1 nitroreductase family protein [Pseudomonadota bacterium]MBU1544880.1 nitroreductase family protein [Pseudomonadota bacterium]MBU2479466.1 nitroreductase family protein [Pseudomonadota bacterium]